MSGAGKSARGRSRARQSRALPRAQPLVPARRPATASPQPSTSTSTYLNGLHADASQQRASHCCDGCDDDSSADDCAGGRSTRRTADSLGRGLLPHEPCALDAGGDGPTIHAQTCRYSARDAGGYRRADCAQPAGQNSRTAGRLVRAGRVRRDHQLPRGQLRRWQFYSATQNTRPSHARHVDVLLCGDPVSHAGCHLLSVLSSFACLRALAVSDCTIDRPSAMQ